MKIATLIIFASLLSCSTHKSNSIQSMLLNRDCNPDSARFSGKDYLYRDQQSNSVAFDHCSKADAMYGTGSPSMYKCEIDVNGKNYAASNKVRSNAKDRVIKKCLSYEKSSKCSEVKCIDL